LNIFPSKGVLSLNNVNSCPSDPARDTLPKLAAKSILPLVPEYAPLSLSFSIAKNPEILIPAGSNIG
jgi:hypothetical protein